LFVIAVRRAIRSLGAVKLGKSGISSNNSGQTPQPGTIDAQGVCDLALKYTTAPGRFAMRILLCALALVSLITLTGCPIYSDDAAVPDAYYMIDADGNRVYYTYDAQGNIVYFD
jgi:hypothetical protein